MAVRRHGGSTFPPVLRKALLWGLGALGALLLLGFIGYAQLLSYLQGEDFRATLEKVVVSKTGATSAEIEGTLGIDSNRVSVRGAKVTRPGMLHGIEGSGLHAELNRAALFERELHITRLMAEEGTFRFESVQNEQAKQPAPAPQQQAPGLMSQAASGFLASLAPTRARLDRFDIKDFNASFRQKGAEYTLADSSLSANPAPRQPKGTWEFRLSNGRVRTPLPVLAESNLKDATLTVGERHSTLSNARLMLSPGELIVNAVYGQAKHDWTADIRANSLELSRLIRGSWQKRLRGVVYGRLRMDGNANGLKQAEGTLSLQQGVLEPLPFLEDLPIGNNYPYRRINFEKATAHLSYPHADVSRNIHRAWLLDQIDLRAEGGWLRIQGHALVDDDGSLAGTLLFGVPESIGKQVAPIGSPLLQSIFNAKGDAGYLWLRLNLSGTLSDPQEDLSARLSTLIGNILPQAADSLRNLFLPAQDSQKPTEEQSAPGEGSTAPSGNSPAQLLEEAGKAAGGILSNGLRSLF